MLRTGVVRMRARRAVGIVAMLMLAAVALPGAASSFTAAPGYSAQNYATGFPVANCCRRGPVGLAFDASDNLYVADPADGHIYRFQPGGGGAGSGTRLTSSPVSGSIAGLAFA